jgi:hypothetical protein
LKIVRKQQLTLGSVHSWIPRQEHSLHIIIIITLGHGKVWFLQSLCCELNQPLGTIGCLSCRRWLGIHHGAVMFIASRAGRAGMSHDAALTIQGVAVGDLGGVSSPSMTIAVLLPFDKSSLPIETRLLFSTASP